VIYFSLEEGRRRRIYVCVWCVIYFGLAIRSQIPPKRLIQTPRDLGDTRLCWSRQGGGEEERSRP
jgi:hypothetical protein